MNGENGIRNTLAFPIERQEIFCIPYFVFSSKSSNAFLHYTTCTLGKVASILEYFNPNKLETMKHTIQKCAEIVTKPK